MSGLFTRLPESTHLGVIITEIVDATTTYIGRSKVSDADPAKPVWQIIRILTAGNTVTETAAGNRGFTQVWDDRATLF